jgi:hypothetical protein
MNIHVQPAISGATLPCLLDKIVLVNGGAVGRITGRSQDGRYGYRVKILGRDDLEILLPPSSLEVLTALPIAPAVSETRIGVDKYARTLDGVVYVIDGGENGYQVARTERPDEECFYSPYELKPWSPLPGELVVEVDNEDCAPGVVVEAKDGTSLIKWPGFAHLQTWANANLEPAWN